MAAPCGVVSSNNLQTSSGQQSMYINLRITSPIETSLPGRLITTAIQSELNGYNWRRIAFRHVPLRLSFLYSFTHYTLNITLKDYTTPCVIVIVSYKTMPIYLHLSQSLIPRYNTAKGWRGSCSIITMYPFFSRTLSPNRTRIVFYRITKSNDERTE